LIDIARHSSARGRQTPARWQKQVFIHTRLSHAYLALARLYCCNCLCILWRYDKLFWYNTGSRTPCDSNDTLCYIYKFYISLLIFNFRTGHRNSHQRPVISQIWLL